MTVVFKFLGTPMKWPSSGTNSLKVQFWAKIGPFLGRFLVTRGVENIFILLPYIFLANVNIICFYESCF